MVSFTDTLSRLLGRVILNNPIDPSSWNVNETIRNVTLPVTADGKVLAIPTFSIDPSKNPITAAGSLGSVNIADSTTPSQEAAVDSYGSIHTSLYGATGAPAAFNNPTGDGNGTGLSLLSLDYNLTYNGSTWDRHRNTGQLFSATDTTTATYTSATINPYNLKSAWIHINNGTQTGTSATLTLNAVDPYTGDTAPIQDSNGSTFGVSLASGTKYNFAWLASPTPGTVTYNSSLATTVTNIIGPPFVPFQVVITKSAITAFDCQISVVGVV